MADQSTDWESHFSSMAPGGTAAAPAPSVPTDWESHFASIAPQAVTTAGPPQTSGWLRQPELAAKTLGRSVMGLLTLPGDIINSVLGPAPDPSKLPLPPPGTAYYQAPPIAGLTGLPPTTQDVAPITNALGITGTPQLTPQGPAERYGYAGLGALPAAGLAIASGGAALPSLVSAVGGAEAGEAAHELAPNSTALPLAAGIVAGTAGQGLASILAGNTVEKVAAGLGESSTLQQAGSAAQEAARQWKNVTMPAKLAAVSTPLDAAIPATTPVSLSNYSGILKTINSRAGDLQASADVLTPGGAKRLQNALSLRDQLAELTGGAEGAPTTWANARAFRSVLGEALSDPMLVKDVGQKNMEALYKGISSDLGETAAGQGAGELWKQYNTESSRLYNFASGPLSKVISSDDPRTESLKPEDVASRLLGAGKKGATDLEALRNEVPDAVDELAAAHLRSTKPWTGLSPEAKVALVPSAQQRDLLTAAVPLKVPGATSTNNALQSILGYGAGTIASAAAHGLGLTHGGPLSLAAAESVGALAPALWHGGAAIVKNPALLRYPAVGATAADIANPLSIQK